MTRDAQRSARSQPSPTPHGAVSRARRRKGRARAAKRWSLICVIGASLFTTSAIAVGTRSFVLDSAASLEGGELAGAAVESSGVVVRGVSTERTGIPDAALASALLTDQKGVSFIGTATDGKVYRFDGRQVALHAETGELMVTDLVRGPRGTLLAATLPNGKILSIDAQGKVSVFATLPEVEHVWALIYDEKRKTVFAGTGPEGKVFKLDAQGKASVYFDSDAEHVMALALAPNGTLFAGTSDDALLFRIDAQGKGEVIRDFEGNEITALALRNGALAVAANLFPKAPAAKATKIKKPGTNGDDDKEEKGGANKNNKKTPVRGQPKPGKGQLWLVEASGRATSLFDSTKGHITDVGWASDNEIYAAAGKDGQVYRVRTDGTHALWIDVDERQVLRMDLDSKYPRFVTGDGAAVYSVIAGRGNDGYWLSKPLDASFHARWGELSFRAHGTLRLQTRSGNTEKPDDSWSAWSAPLSKPGPIRSAPARFIQLRAQLEADAQLFAITAHYLPRNQAPIIASLTATPKRDKKQKKDAPTLPTTVYAVTWKTANPDSDELRFRIAYRPERGTHFRPLLHEHEVLSEQKFEWDTENVPDGFYVVQVQASDELDNPGGRHETDVKISEPVLIDNHAPEVLDLQVRGGRLVGRARDSLGPLQELKFRVDQDPWLTLYPVDDMLDTAEERFDVPLPKMPAGDHVVAVRAVDARHNVGSAEAEFTTK